VNDRIDAEIDHHPSLAFANSRKPFFEYVEHHNNQAEGCHWKTLPEEILAKVHRARAILDKTPPA
jgi:hypothetical protein